MLPQKFHATIKESTNLHVYIDTIIGSEFWVELTHQVFCIVLVFKVKIIASFPPSKSSQRF